MKTQRTSSRRSSGAHLDTTTIRLEEAFSLSCRRGGEGGGEDATIIECPSPQPSPDSFLAGRGRKFLVVLSRYAGSKVSPNFFHSSTTAKISELASRARFYMS